MQTQSVRLDICIDASPENNSLQGFWRPDWFLCFILQALTPGDLTKEGLRAAIAHLLRLELKY